MNTSEQALVVILSASLAVLLGLSIIAVVKIIQILNTIKSITDRAEVLTEKAEVIGNFVQKAAGPIAIGRLITNIADNVFQSRSSNKTSTTKHKGEKDEE